MKVIPHTIRMPTQSGDVQATVTIKHNLERHKKLVSKHLTSSALFKTEMRRERRHGGSLFRFFVFFLCFSCVFFRKKGVAVASTSPD
jgi:hypothetical protein